MSKNWLLIFPIVALAGCMVPYGGTFKFDGPSGATEQQFVQEFYQCAKANTTTVASGLLNKFGGNYSQKTLPSCSMMMVCLRAKGFYPSKEGQFDSRSYAVPCTP